MAGRRAAVAVLVNGLESDRQRTGDPTRAAQRRRTAVSRSGDWAGGSAFTCETTDLQLPEVQSLDDPDRAEVVALRASIGELITEITIGQAHPT